jgi:translation initiation factor 1 (eIF-1/SUI1)
MAVVLNIASEFNNKGIRQATQQFQGLQDAGKRAGNALKKSIIPATVAVAALGAVLVSAVKGAMEDEVAQKELARVLKSTTKATDAQIAAVEDWITVQGQVLGITDDELRPAYAGLLRATKSVTKAQKLSAIAFDLAAAKGKPLAAVTKAIEQALGGNMVALAKLAPEYRDMIKNGASFEEIMKKVAEATGGAAAGAADTAAGKMKRLKIRFDELKETVGYALLPVLGTLLDFIMDKIIPAFESLGGLIGDFGKTMKADGVSKAVGKSFGKVGDYLKNDALPAIADALNKMGKALVGWIRPNFKPMMKALGSFIASAANYMVNTGLPNMIAKMKILGQAFVDWIEPNIEPMLEELGKLISAVAVWLVTDGLPKLVKLWGQWNAALLGWMVQIAPELAKGLGKMALELSAVFPRIIAKIAPEFAKFGVAMGKAAANGIIDQINAAFDRIANMAKGPLGGLLPDIDVPNIPYLAKGGIVKRPTLAMIGEAGPEAVVPLSKMGGMGGGINITVQTGVGDPVAIGKAVSDVLNAYNRRTGNAAA